MSEGEPNNDYDDYYDADADRSYSFTYSEDRGVPGWISNRQEQSDADGTVTGRYSYVNDDGNEIAVQYRAGADIGFVVENKEELEASVRKATEEGAPKVAKVKSKENNSKDGSPSRRRMVVRKGQRRVSNHKEKNTPHADPLSIVKVSSTSRKSSLGRSIQTLYWFNSI